MISLKFPPNGEIGKADFCCGNLWYALEHRFGKRGHITYWQQEMALRKQTWEKSTRNCPPNTEENSRIRQSLGGGKSVKISVILMYFSKILKRVVRKMAEVTPDKKEKNPSKPSFRCKKQWQTLKKILIAMDLNDCWIPLVKNMV